jgi:leader peptidase (prepilin peptidase) / N-methyltransferase
MIRILATTFAAMLGLAFGSFLNVCVSRWPVDESVVTPRSHCRTCAHMLACWENVPLLSWLILRGHCRTCRTAISWRYPLVELSVALLWAAAAARYVPAALDPNASTREATCALLAMAGKFAFDWSLVALAALDAENLWLPNMLTLPGILIGFSYSLLPWHLIDRLPIFGIREATAAGLALRSLLAIVTAAGMVLLLRWLYRVIRHREGMGLGDVKLMALLAAWLGLPGTLLAFLIGTFLGAVAGIVVILFPSKREDPKDWATTRLPFGTFLCIGGIVSSLWGVTIINAYMRWVGL